ncbi:LRR receptor-like serine/threonine-protein kinase GSO1 [Cinnamomum micranthum f. kanehirae]|uniref:LRR receptor-like serine/threonine-protein kinase GSO1 n=1 Tax=Cinnamomum micranthum f. kanehirae TaxID=337451 RepID=A0A443NPH8_9MAGN|nr:LRR receptor-like serine/threonine-protein kinase GSO1 [Cinnamomum micranthum f. kanehirae]
MRMETPFAYASMVLFIVVSCCCCCCCHGCLEVERKALLQIKESINYPNGSALPSWVGKNCCEWRKVTCDPSSSHVKTIDLKERRNASFGKWSPNATLFSQFKNLVEIDLSDNMIQMNGSHMLQAFCGMEFLEILDIHNNLLEGVLPACLGNMPSLRVLGLARNRFTGEIPSFLSNLSSVQEIDVGSNLFDGVVSLSMFSKLSDLSTLILSDNKQLEVETEPLTWVPSFQLTSLHLAKCNLNKHHGNMIPSFISTQLILVELDLSHNSLKGSIPTWMFYNVSNLLELKNNMFSGQFLQHSADFNFSSLKVLDISDNNVHGSLPDNFGELFPDLTLIHMSNNSLQGNIPPSFGEMLSLELLDLSNNNLTGEIPQNLTVKGVLKYLMLSNNSLRGEMLPRDCNLTELKLLQLDSNHFTGAIPACLSNSPDLEYLDIRNNHLSGNLSSWLPIFPEMKVLLLGRNSFRGHIPKQLCQMQKLQFLDISNSSLSGYIPSCLNKITSWKNLSLSSNGSTLGVVKSPFKNAGIKIRVVFTTKYISYEYEGAPLAFMIGIDISSNSLTGDIPFEMGDLREVRSLNLSNNLLTGPLPASFQKLKNLETLDLSHNELNGTIPREFLQMTSLNTFSVAFNNLSGKIPYDRQFWTFNETSFMGNPYLCGKPLERNCSSDNQTQHHNEGEEEYRLIDKPLFLYMIVAVSYILGFWIVIVPLIFNRNWRQTYFKVIDVHVSFCFEKLSMFWCH